MDWMDRNFGKLMVAGVIVSVAWWAFVIAVIVLILNHFGIV